MMPNKLKLAAIYLLLISGVSPLHVAFPSFEHFPYGLLCLLLFNKANKDSLILASLLIVFYCLTLLFYFFIDGNGNIVPLVGFLNIISPLFFFKGNEGLIGRAAFNVFWLYIAVGILQVFSLLVPVEDYVRFFISRFEGAPLGGGYRGVQMLETEPARASFQLLALYILSTSLFGKWNNVMLLFLVGAQSLLISSTTGLILTAGFLVFRFAIDFLKRPQLVFLLIIGAVVIAPKIESNPKTKVMIDLYQEKGVAGIHTALAATSGGRYLGTVNTLEAIAKWPFGYGSDPSFLRGEKVHVNTHNVKGYSTRVSSRPVSSTLNYIYVFGAPMFVLLLVVARNVVGKLYITSKVAFVVLLTLAYSPPSGAISVLLLLSVMTESKWNKASAKFSQANEAYSSSRWVPSDKQDGLFSAR